MLPRRLASLILAVLAASGIAACSDQAPVSPQGIPDGSTPLARSVAGTYTMSFQPTSSGLGVVLDAYVTDALGNPAQQGTAVFQFCSLQGTPSPSATCDTGSGRWAFYGRAGIASSLSPLVGHALLAYIEAPTPGTTIGFRFKYAAQGGPIVNGVSASADHTF